MIVEGEACQSDEAPLSLLAQAELMNKDFVGSTDYRVEPYMHKDRRPRSTEWRFQIVHKLTGECLTRNLVPEGADAHTYMLLISAAVKHGNRMHDEGEADALNLLYQHFAKVLAIKPHLQLRTRESAISEYRRDNPHLFKQE